MKPDIGLEGQQFSDFVISINHDLEYTPKNDLHGKPYPPEKVRPLKNAWRDVFIKVVKGVTGASTLKQKYELVRRYALEAWADEIPDNSRQAITFAELFTIFYHQWEQKKENEKAKATQTDCQDQTVQEVLR